MQQLSIRHLFVGACAASLVAQFALARTSQHRESDLDLNSIDNELTSMERVAY